MRLEEKYHRLFFFDLETTGLNFKEDRIIELGLVCFEYNARIMKFEKKEEIDKFVRISFPIPEKIVELTHITDNMLLEKGIGEKEIYKIVNERIDSRTLVIGYNVQFDINFLTELFRRERNEPDFMFNVDLLDVMAIYKDLHDYPSRLKDAIETFDIDIPNSHRAIDDILATCEVLRCLMKECMKNNIEYTDYINVFGFNYKYGVSGERQPRVMYVKQDCGKRDIQRYKRVG